MADKITLNDGTELTGSVIQDENILWLYIAGETFVSVFNCLSNQDKTRIIKVHEYNVTNKYTGYTHLFSLREEPGNICAGLERR